MERRQARRRLRRERLRGGDRVVRSVRGRPGAAARARALGRRLRVVRPRRVAKLAGTRLVYFYVFLFNCSILFW